jgi:hypothetical protein
VTAAEAWRALLALVLLGLVAWVPGYALHRLLLPTRGRLAALATAPALSAGLLYVSGEVLSAADLRVDAWLAGGLALLGCVGVAVDLRRHGGPPRPRRSVTAPLVTAVGLATAIWSLGIRHLTAVPPHNDGYNHGFFVRRIADLHSLEPATVLPHDVLLGGHGVDYYPLALHQQAAVLVQVLGLDVAVAWTLTALSTTVVALPLGMLLLGRRLFPDRREVAAACAVVSALVPGLTYSTSWWGGFALAAGFAASAGTLVLAAQATERWSWRTLLAASLALAGVAGMHTSEYSLLLVLVGVLALTDALPRRSLAAVVGAGLRVGTLLLGSLVLLAPAIVQLHRGLDERAYPIPDRGIPLSDALREVVVQFSFVPPVTPTAIVLASWIGLIGCLVARRALGWVACWLVFAVLYVWLAAYPAGLVTSLTATWYSDRFRLAYILAFLAIPFLAYAVAGGTTAVRRELRLAGPVLGVVLVATSSVASVHAIHRNYRDFSLVGRDERRAFAFLAAHVGPDEHVLNQHQDGSPWMYSLDRVAPVVALKTFDFERPEWRDANYLARHVQDVGQDPEVDRLLRSFDIRYVYLGPAVFPTEKPDLDRSALDASPGLRLVFQAGRCRVYKVVR